MDPAANTGLFAAIARGAPVARVGESLLAIDGACLRLSDPCAVADALAFARFAGDATMLRGPADAADALAARLPGAWTRIFEGHEMAWSGVAVAPVAPGELRAAAHAHADWRAAFIAEAFVAGGSPPSVALDQLFVWFDRDQPRCMAGLLPLSADTRRVVTVYTPPADRGRGYAASLVGALAPHASVPWVSLDVGVDNPAGLRAYQRAGFRVVGHTATWTRAA